TALIAESDYSANEFVWVTSEAIDFTTDVDGHNMLVAKNLEKGMEILLNRGQILSLSVGEGRVRTMVFSHSSAAPVIQAYDSRIAPGGERTSIVAHPNDELLEQLDLPKPESVKVKVEGADMQMWILRPPGFDEKKKWPVAYLVHGGPQGAWTDEWHNRW